MSGAEAQRFRNENVKLNGPCLTSLLIPRNSFPVCGTFPLHPAYVPHSLLCSNSSVFPDSSRWPAVSQACSCHSNQSSGCLVYTSSHNAPGSRTYQLQMRPGPSTHSSLEWAYFHRVPLPMGRLKQCLHGLNVLIKMRMGEWVSSYVQQTLGVLKVQTK